MKTYQHKQEKQTRSDKYINWFPSRPPVPIPARGRKASLDDVTSQTRENEKLMIRAENIQERKAEDVVPEWGIVLTGDPYQGLMLKNADMVSSVYSAYPGML